METQQLQKCTIVNLDDGGQIPAQYNPKSIKLGKSAQWKREESLNGDADMLTFGNTKNRSLSFELFFDGLENREYRQDGRQTPVNVERKYVEPLTKMLMPEDGRDTGKGNEKARRPPFIMVIWGCMRPFRGVIEKIDYEFSMFLPDGTPVRATATINITEVDIIQMTGRHKSNFEQTVNRMKTPTGGIEDASKDLKWEG